MPHLFTARAPTRLIQCRFGGPGGNFGGSNPPGQPPKLIIPGQSPASNPSRPGGNLVIPGNQGPQPSITGAQPTLDAPAARNFRPPPGFMDADGGQKVESSIPPEEMLNRLQAQAGHWHQLAKLLPALQNKGYDAFVVEEMTGLERKLQNLWISAASIYDALQKSGQVSPEILSYFDTPGAETLLHELRFLSLRQRIAAVIYIVENSIEDAAECTVLARSVKEHERRNGKRDGFSDSPADCLAYKYYRDALECRRQEDAEIYAQKGLEIVESEEGRKKLASVVSDVAAATEQSFSSDAILSVLRLEKDEIGCRPIALAGELATATAEKVRSAPKVASEGPFAAFTVPADGATWRWAPLPAWAIVSLAGRPVALDVPNCADLGSLRASLKIKSDDELRKLQGPGLMVIDLQSSTKGDDLDAAAYYLVEKDNGGVDVVDGASISDASKVLGPVLFLCRPPARDTTGSTTAELLSL